MMVKMMTTETTVMIIGFGFQRCEPQSQQLLTNPKTIALLHSLFAHLSKSPTVTVRT